MTFKFISFYRASRLCFPLLTYTFQSYLTILVSLLGTGLNADRARSEAEAAFSAALRHVQLWSDDKEARRASLADAAAHHDSAHLHTFNASYAFPAGSKHDNMVWVCEHLLPRSTRLRTLSLSGWGIGFQQEANQPSPVPSALARALRRMPLLETLVLKDCSLDATGLAVILAAAPELPLLTVLDLSKNDNVRAAGATPLVAALPWLRGLHRLYLKGCRITAVGMVRSPSCSSQ